MAGSTTPWGQFSQADYTPEQWHRACLIHTHDGDPTAKDRCKLPVREPSGALNVNGVHAAAARIGQVDVPAADKQAAAKKLVGLYGDIGDPPPASLRRLAGESVKAAERQGPAILGGLLVLGDGATPLLKVPFYRVGRWEHPTYGTISATSEDLGTIEANFRNGVLGRKPYLRLGHDSDAAPRATFGDTKALGWVEDVRREGDVLYAYVAPTDQQAVELVASKAMRYASGELRPHYVTKTDRREVGTVLEAVALTNEPFLTDLGDATVVLADRPAGTVALDYGLPAPAAGMEDTDVSDDIKQALDNNTSVLTKFSEWLMGGGKPPAGVVEPPKAADDAAVKLAEAQQAAATAQAQLLAERTAREAAEVAAHATRVEAEATRLVAAGLPPVQVARLKPLLLAARGERGTIKLADAAGALTDAPLYDSLVALAEALPDAQRVQLGQRGTVEPKPPGEQDTDPNDPAVQAKARKLAEEFAGMAGAKLADAPKGNGTH